MQNKMQKEGETLGVTRGGSRGRRGEGVEVREGSL